MTARVMLASGALLILFTGCTTTESPRAEQRASPPSPHVSVSGSALAGLRTVHWGQVSVPGTACFQNEPIPLRGGKATFRASAAALSHDDSRQQHDVLYADTDEVTYADITGDGVEDALLPLTCSNGGGTADGQLLFTFVLFSGSPTQLRALGVITPQVQRPHEHVTLIDPDLGLTISKQTILVQEAWYGPNDCTAGPTGKALTTWVYASARLTVKSSKITAQSTGSCP